MADTGGGGSTAKRAHDRQHASARKKYKKWGGRKKAELRSGLTGFLITTQNIRDDRRCINEAYALLNEAEAQMRDQYSDDKPQQQADVQEKQTPETTEATSSEGQSIEDLLKQEMKELSDPKTIERTSTFNSANVGCKGMMFITSESAVPVKALADTIYGRAKATPGGISRFVQRFLPIQITCRAEPETIAKTLQTLLQGSPLDPAAPSTTFKVHFKSRYNNTLSREATISAIGQRLLDLAPQHKADLKQPSVMITIEVVKNVCCMSILEDFTQRCRYNLSETSRRAHEPSSPRSEKDTASKHQPTGETEVHKQTQGHAEQASPEPAVKQDAA